ncbi:MAG TPA: GAF domain-containing protein, partial [Desulfobacteraceae bacterium]|nr:GAF domain-containing protein [Desulfobacteraceae bacterium]
MEKKQQHRITDPADADKTIEVLFEISHAVSTTFNLDELYRAIHTSLGKIINVNNFFIAMIDQDAGTLSFPCWIDEKDDSPPKLSIFSKPLSLTGRVIQAKTPLMFTEDQIKEIIAIDPRGIAGTPCKVWLGAPLMVKNSVIGAMAVQSYSDGNIYKQADLDLLNLVAQHIALAIERKQTDEALHNQRAILEKILETSPVGVCLLENRTFQWVNNELVRLFGYTSKTDLEGKNAEMVYPSRESYTRAGENFYSELKQTGKADMDLEFMRRDGSVFPGHIQLGSADPSDPMSWTIATVSDLSVRKRAEEERNRNEKLKVVLEMAGAVCHELNQPLQAIIGYIEIIMMDNEKDGPFSNELKAIDNQTKR